MPDDSAFLSTEVPATDVAAASPAAGAPAWAWGQPAEQEQRQGLHGPADRAAWAAERRRMERFRSDGPRNPVLRLARAAALQAFDIGLRATGLALLGRHNAKAVSISTASAVIPTLPDALQGLRILFLTDPHFDCMDNFADRVVERVRGLQCDLLLAGGDYRFGNEVRFTETGTVDALARLRDAIDVRLGSYAILGNHDCVDMVPGIERAGFQVLANETAVVEANGATLSLTGLDDVYTFPTQAARDALSRGPLVPADFSIALVHSPDLAHEAAEAGHHLYLCGHTHGGQICLPGGKPIIMPTRNRGFGTGQWQAGGMTGYTSRGIGTSTLPYRFNCPPEILALTLRKH